MAGARDGAAVGGARNGSNTATSDDAALVHMANLFQTAMFYPKNLFRILVEVGHEPLPSVSGRTWCGFGQRVYYMPNVLTYCNHIRRTDGFTGLFRGVLPHLCGAAAQQATAWYLCSKFPAPPNNTGGRAIASNTNDLVREIARKTTIRALTVAVGHPFHVITVRMIAYYVGREVAYSTVLGTVRTIYENEGLGGFFTGLVPRLAGEMLAVVAFELLVPVILEITETPAMEAGARKKLQEHASVVVTFVVQIFVYPFQLTSTLMIVDGSGMAAASAVPAGGSGSWRKCLSALYSCGEYMRGSAMFSRIDKKKSYGTVV